MKRLFALGLVVLGTSIAAFSTTACAPTLSQPFQGLKQQPIQILRLQDYEPQAAAAGGGVALPPILQQWLGAGAQLLPPGLLPPGLLPGGTPAASSSVTKFYNFKIIGSMTVSDNKMREEILELFGKESNFQAPKLACTGAPDGIYAEFGFQIGQPLPPGTPQGTPSTTPPADILVSLSCDQVRMYNYAWPYGAKTGLGPDTSKKIIAIVQRAFGS